MDLKLTRTRRILLFLFIAGFLYKMYPRFMVYEWIHAEEVYNFITVDDLVKFRTARLSQFYPVLEHYFVYVLWFVTRINHKILSYIINPLLISLSVIPLYLFLKEICPEGESLAVCALWTFSESVFYRTSHFGSTETLGLLFMTVGMYLYIKKKYLFLIPTLVVMVYAHLLPFAYLVVVIIGHRLLTGTRKQIFITIALGLFGLLFLYSPFNPHPRITSVIAIDELLSWLSISNIFLYSLSELAMGVVMFSGTLVLLIGGGMYVFVNRQTNKFMLSGLIVAFGLMLLGWFAYSPYLVGPPRLTVYFVIPLSYYIVKFISKISSQKELLPKISILCFIMILSSYSGLPRMLYINDALTKGERLAIDELGDMGILGRTNNWWCDYTVRASLLLRSNDTVWTVEVDKIRIVNESLSLVNPLMSHKPVFEYVFLSERMERSAFYILRNGTRSTHIRKPVEDTWFDDPRWELEYHNHGVKVYGRTS